MNSVIKYFFSSVIISFFTSYAFQGPIPTIGQKNLYHKSDLVETVCSSLKDAVTAYHKKDYTMAALLLEGAQTYTTAMNLPQFDNNTQKIISFLTADCHIKRKSPQHALSAFHTIHDQDIYYEKVFLGKITSEQIAGSLTKKSLYCNDISLTQKLRDQAQQFYAIDAQIKLEARIQQYKKEYKDYSIEKIISLLKTTQDQEKIDSLMSYVQEYVTKNDLTALAFMAQAYNTGLYGIKPSQQQAFDYISQYVTALPHNAKLSPQAKNPSNNSLICLTKSKKVIPYVCKANKQISDTLYSLVVDLLLTPNNDIIDYLSTLQQLETLNDFKSNIRQFITANEDTIIPLLQTAATKINHKNTINYILGLLYYYKKNYQNALFYFNLSNQRAHDLLTEYRTIKCQQIIENKDTAFYIQLLIPYIQKINTASKKKGRNALAHSLLYNELSQISTSYLYELLNTGEHELAQNFARLLLQTTQTAPLTIDVIKQISNVLHSSTTETRSSLHTFYNSRLFNDLKKYNTQQHDAKTNLSLAHILTNYLIHYSLTQEEQQTVTKQIIAYLQSAENNASWNNTFHKEAATLYYILGTHDNNIEYLNKAILYGKDEAMYEKALLLLEQPRTSAVEKEALILLERHVQGSATNKAQSLNKLAELYFPYATKKSLLECIAPDDIQSYHYLKLAHELGNADLIGLLGIFHAHGIKRGTKWILPAHERVALKYFEQALQKPTQHDAEIHYVRGILYHKLGLLEESYKDFDTINLTDLSEIPNSSAIFYNPKLTTLFYKSQIKLKSPNKTDQDQGILFLDEALSLRNFSTPIIMEKDIHSLLYQHTQDILKNNKSTPTDVIWCSTTGRVLRIMNQSIDIGEEQARHAIQCLIHAANNGCFKSQAIISLLPAKEVDVKISIKNLLKVYSVCHSKNDQESKTFIRSKFIKRLPDTVDKHYELIAHYCDNNDYETVNDYLTLALLCKPITLDNELTEEQINPLVQHCSMNAFIKNLAQEYRKNPEKSNTIQQSAAIVLSCLYSYAADKDLLITGAAYLETLRTPPTTINSSPFLAILYHKLALYFEQENIPALSLEYFKKSALCGHYDSIIKLTKKWLENGPLTPNIVPEAIIFLLRSIQLESQRPDIQKLIDQAQEKQRILDNQHKQLEQGIAQQEKIHPYRKTLIRLEESFHSKNKKLIQACNLYLENQKKSLELLNSLARSKKPNPHAYLGLAMHYTDTIDKFEEYIQKAFLYGIVINTKKEHVFIDFLFLCKVCSFIDNFVKSTTEKNAKLIIQSTLKALTNQHINMEQFKKYLLDTRNINLDKYK